MHLVTIAFNNMEVINNLARTVMMKCGGKWLSGMDSREWENTVVVGNSEFCCKVKQWKEAESGDRGKQS